MKAIAVAMILCALLFCDTAITIKYGYSHELGQFFGILAVFFFFVFMAMLAFSQ